MRNLIAFFALAITTSTCCSAQQLSTENTVRIREFYRMPAKDQDQLWTNWSSIPAPILLIVGEQEFLTHYPSPPRDFTKVADDLYRRPRQFPAGLLATFPAFGPPSVIVVGEAEHTSAKTSTPWLITVMHEHFHQLQDAQPGIFESLEKLGLSHGDKSGMWMLNYPFPYNKPDVVEGFVRLCKLLLGALAESDPTSFARSAHQYVTARREFFAQLAPDDHKYLGFQLWKEGIARYSQVKFAEAVADYQPSTEYAALPDYESFDHYAAHARHDTLDELQKADIQTWKRTIVYSWGATEGFLLDRLKPEWRKDYFKQPFSLDSYFD